MKLIFIRHGEPDYENDALTPNGVEEAKLLADRIKNWNVTKFYVSPFGRAKQTASYTLELLNKEAECLEYLREFSYKVDDPVTGRHGVPWDFVASDWTKYESNFSLEDGFLNYPCIKQNPEIAQNYSVVIENFDKLLSSYGYDRTGKYYINRNGISRKLKATVSPDNKVRNNGLYGDGQKETTLVFFCHLGVTCLILSHLLNIPFETLTHGFFLAPTSITVVSTEERWEKEAYFRVQAMGDTSHLLLGNHKISPAGSFSDPFIG